MNSLPESCASPEVPYELGRHTSIHLHLEDDWLRLSQTKWSLQLHGEQHYWHTYTPNALHHSCCFRHGLRYGTCTMSRLAATRAQYADTRSIDEVMSHFRHHNIMYRSMHNLRTCVQYSTCLCILVSLIGDWSGLR